MPVHIHNDTPLALAHFAGKVRKNPWDLTLVVKGRYAIGAGSCTPVTDRPLFDGDVPWTEEGPSSHRCASDFAPFKPRADVLLTGTCYPPRDRSRPFARATLRLGALDKTLHVYGERVFKPRELAGWTVAEVTAPSPLSLRYEHAFGGATYPPNPVGLGHANVGHSLEEGVRPAPRIEYHNVPVTAPTDAPLPAGFGPLDPRWPQRASKLGTYDATWLARNWPFFPDDFDWAYFNAAPADQQLAYLRGDEAFILEGLHPEHARVESRLPLVRPRCFVKKHDKHGDAIEEVTLLLDTVSIDADAMELVVLWRGLVPVASRDYAEVSEALLVSESMLDAPRSSHEYADARFWQRQGPSVQELAAQEDAAAREAPLEMPATPEHPSIDDLEAEADAAELAQARKDLEEGGVDPKLLERLKGVTDPAAFLEIVKAYVTEEVGLTPAEAEPAEAEAVAHEPSAAELRLEAKRLAREAEGEALAAAKRELTEGGVDPALLAKLDEEKTEFGFLRRMIMETAPTGTEAEIAERDAAIAAIDAAEQNEREAELAADADLRATRGERLTRDEASALAKQGGNLSGANLTELDLSGVDWPGVNLSGANLVGATLDRANLSGADLSNAALRLASLKGAWLNDAVLQGAALDAANFEGANATRANLAKATGEGVQFSGANLGEADLGQTKLVGAQFVAAGLERTQFYGADLTGANFTGARAARVDLRLTTLSDAELSKADLSGALLRGATLTRARFDGANLHGANLETARGRGLSFREANLTNARAGGLDAPGAQLSRSIAETANFDGANLMHAEFRAARLARANFGSADLTHANLTLARLEGAALLKAKLQGADLTKCNGFRARLTGADLRGADCRGSNFFEADFYEAVVTDARFDRSVLTRTCIAARSAS